MVIWLIGLSGAGKTTLGRAVVDQAAPLRPVFIDGDVIRKVFGGDLGHTLEDRWRNAQRISRLCKFLDDQGIPVVCAILSLFPESRKWNREQIRNYYEVFIDAPLDQLEARDPKGLYKKARAGEMKNVAGIDLPFPPPESPDLIIENRGDLAALLAFAPQLAAILTE
jgi:adenylylsulfate kinase